MKKINYKIGQIVPSSNTTMETEIPAIFRAREKLFKERFTFHSSRMRMKEVSPEELKAMDCDSDRCALELSDARVDVLGYACLVAIMSMSKGYHRVSQKRLHEITLKNQGGAPVISSAGALIDGLHTMKAKKISILTPYMKPLTKLVVDYIENEGIEVVDAVSLEISNNLEVGARDPLAPSTLYTKLNTKDVDVVVLSACVQMPSLSSVEIVENKINIPVTTASICTSYQMLKALNLEAKVDNCGALLSGKY